MLAQNFQTPAALKISDAEFEALVKVLGMLERGEIEHSPGIQFDKIDKRACMPPTGFNIAAFYCKTDCGTAACICGWAEFVGRLDPFSLAARRYGNRGLMQLFEPSMGGENITPAQAAIALRSYLSTGEARWSEALSG